MFNRIWKTTYTQVNNKKNKNKKRDCSQSCPMATDAKSLAFKVLLDKKSDKIKEIKKILFLTQIQYKRTITWDPVQICKFYRFCCLRCWLSLFQAIIYCNNSIYCQLLWYSNVCVSSFWKKFFFFSNRICVSICVCVLFFIQVLVFSLRKCHKVIHWNPKKKISFSFQYIHSFFWIMTSNNKVVNK